MTELFKKMVFSGVGFAVATAEKFQETVETMIKDGKLSNEEGKKVVDELISKTETKREEFEEQIKKVGEEFWNKFSANNISEIADLKSRLEKLENEMAAKAEKK